MGSMFDAKRYLFKLRQHWPWWLAAAVLIFAAGNALGLLLPKKYAVSARIRVYPPLVSSGKDSGLLDPTSELRVIKDRFSSPSYYDAPDKNGDSIIGKLNLAKGLSRQSSEYQNLKRGIAERMVVWPRQNNLVDLNYWDYDPNIAYHVLDEAINKWRNETEQMIGRMTSGNKAQLEAQLRQAQDRQTSASQAVLAYKTKHPEVIPEAYSEHRSQRDELIRTRTTNEQKIRALQDSITLAEAQLKRESQFITTRKMVERDHPEIRQMQVDLASMEREMSLMLQSLKENHPRVRDLKRKIDLQKEMVDKALKDPKLNAAEQTESANPSWQMHRDELDKMRLDLQQTRTMVVEADKSIKTLDQYLAQIPAQQAVLEGLLRNESLYRTEAENLKAKLFAADYVSQIQDQYGFTIERVENPEVPMSPSAPRKSMIAGMSAAMSLGGVAVLVWIAMMLDMAVRSVEEARGLLRMPVLGVVQPIPQSTRARRRRMAA
ncbi:hypothetical protein LLG95_13290 [bacterium]|nr:hypothetical protein [bacterium]